jgi:hypothetical protein
MSFMVGAGTPLRVSASSSLGSDDVVWLRFTEGRGTSVQIAAVWLRRLLERDVVDVGLAPVVLGCRWAGRLGLLLILAFFSQPSAFPDLGLASVAKLVRFCLPLDGFTGSAGGGLSDGLLSALLLWGCY